MQQERPIQKRRGRPWALPAVNIAWCYDWRGENDDQLTFMFKGAPAQMVGKVFTFLCAAGNGCAKDFSIEEGHDPVRRQGHCYHRLLVTLKEYQQHFASPKDMMILIESQFRQLSSGKLMPCGVDEFINL